MNLVVFFVGAALLSSAILAKGPSIPRNVTEAQDGFAQHLSANAIAQVRAMKSEEEAMLSMDMDMLVGLTNEWQLWADSPLARYFKHIGVDKPHDMVGVVAETYWCKLHHRPFALQAKVSALRRFYAQQKAEEPKGNSPRDGGKIEWSDIRVSRKGTLYLGVSQSDGSFWRYNYKNGRGIEPAHADEAKEVASHIARDSYDLARRTRNTAH